MIQTTSIKYNPCLAASQSLHLVLLKCEETQYGRLDVLLRLVVSTNPSEDEVSSLLFTSSSLKLLELVGEFWSFHRNLLWSIYGLAVNFT